MRSKRKTTWLARDPLARAPCEDASLGRRRSKPRAAGASLTETQRVCCRDARVTERCAETGPRPADITTTSATMGKTDIKVKIKLEEKKFRDSCSIRSVPAKHKYCYILGRSKKETKELKNIFLERNPKKANLAYPQTRGI